MAYLEVKNLMKSFDDLQVLKGIDFSLEKGEVLSVIGSSGNGKTTLLRCINNLVSVDSGEVYVDGELVSYEEDKTFSKDLTFGLVFQSFNLFPQYTALENVMLSPNVRLKARLKALGLKGKALKEQYEIEKEQNKEEALKLLEQVGLSDKTDYYPCQLSGGQQQRVAIARALALNPKVLCFDEPTSALDPELTGEVLKVIKSLKTFNKTMIIITHEMDFARNISDKVMFMLDGMVEEFGTPEQIFSNPKSEHTKAFLAPYLEKKQ